MGLSTPLLGKIGLMSEMDNAYLTEGIPRNFWKVHEIRNLKYFHARYTYSIRVTGLSKGVAPNVLCCTIHHSLWPNVGHGWRSLKEWYVCLDLMCQSSNDDVMLTIAFLFCFCFLCCAEPVTTHYSVIVSVPSATIHYSVIVFTNFL